MKIFTFEDNPDKQLIGKIVLMAHPETGRLYTESIFNITVGKK